MLTPTYPTFVLARSSRNSTAARRICGVQGESVSSRTSSLRPYSIARTGTAIGLLTNVPNSIVSNRFATARSDSAFLVEIGINIGYVLPHCEQNSNFST